MTAARTAAQGTRWGSRSSRKKPTSESTAPVVSADQAAATVPLRQYSPPMMVTPAPAR